jgi:hypothetical protein
MTNFDLAAHNERESSFHLATTIQIVAIRSLLRVLASGTRYRWKSDQHVASKHLRNLTSLTHQLGDKYPPLYCVIFVFFS